MLDRLVKLDKDVLNIIVNEQNLKKEKQFLGNIINNK